ncbi:MAG: hypothetical protein GC190_10120 [Alphaproteobacteria bacterium]|nr:hypothetical protein [Alphaproteobacteria bacterium]
MQFFEIAPTFQLTVAVGSLLILGWVAYATVVVLFKDQIIVAKNQRYAHMRAAYEERLTQVDALTKALVVQCRRAQNCDINEVVATSSDPAAALAGLRSIDPSAADHANKTDTSYEPNAAYDTLATTWDIMKSALGELRWIATRGKDGEVSDDTTFQIFVATLWGGLCLLTVLVWRLVVRATRRKADTTSADRESQTPNTSTNRTT